MVAPFRAWPYAALAVVQWLHTAPSLFLWVVFRHPMDQTVKPPLAKWIVSVDGVPKTPASSSWVDEWTLLLTVAAIPALPADVTLEYAGPDADLQTTWQKQWEPWGAIVATSFEFIAPGIIVMWHGAVVDIPPGWVLCDGNNSTPNLSFRFVRGQAGPIPPGTTGGSTTHDHTFTGDGHNHELISAPGNALQAGADYRRFVTVDPASGTTDSTLTLPPWYALAYIMKV